jgi:hypothetical protein
MSEVLFIPSAKVEDGQPTPWFRLRLDTAYSRYLETPEQVSAFVISGRWSDTTTAIEQTEAAIAREYLLSLQPDLNVLIDERAVETGGNFAFSAPIIESLHPERVTTFNSAVYRLRMEYFARKIFGPGWLTQHVLIDDEYSANPRAQQKEPKALVMFQRLFDGITDGDFTAAQEILLEHTPFYDRSKVDNQGFFDAYWPGGFLDFIGKRKSMDKE